MDDMQLGNYKDVALYKLDRAKDELETSQILFSAGKYKAANNRAYYACFHAVNGVLALEPIAFKKHKDVLAYFNKQYVHTEIFPRDLGRKISRLEIIRHKSDYDDFYIASKEEASEQIEIGKMVVGLVETYILEQTETNE